MSKEQRDLVQQSANMADSPEDRHGVYRDRRRQPVSLDDDMLGQIRQIVREEIQRDIQERGKRSAEFE